MTVTLNKFVAMNSPLRQGCIAALLVSSSILFAPKLLAQELERTVLDVTPQRCVTLRQGQPCFVRLRFEWTSVEALEACLIDSEGTEIKCWVSASQGSVMLPRNLLNTTEYVLINSNGEELKRATVVVSWVYRNKRSRRRWRLF